MSKGPIILTQQQVCELLRVSRPTISKYHAKGMPIIQRGKYDAGDVVRWFVQYQVAMVKVDQGAALTGKATDPETRLLEARAIKIEMENQEKLREIVKIDEFSSIFNWFSTLVANSFESMGARLANILAGMDEPAEIQAEILRESRQIRRLLANKLQKQDLKLVLQDVAINKDS